MLKGKRCEIDGTREKDENGRCCECARYARGIAEGRIEGVDGRKARKEAEAKMNFEVENYEIPSGI
jgi:hypothetical protein